MSPEFGSVKIRNGGHGGSVLHLDKPKTAWATSFAIGDQLYGLDVTMLCKQLTDLVLG
jgi:hypothetical protein